MTEVPDHEPSRAVAAPAEVSAVPPRCPICDHEIRADHGERREGIDGAEICVDCPACWYEADVQIPT